MTKDSKKEEIGNSSEESADNSQSADNQEDDTSQKTESEEKTLEEQLSEEKEARLKAEKKAKDFERAFFGEKEKRRGLEIKSSFNSQTDESEVNLKVQQALREERIKSTFKEFVGNTSDLHEANDLDGLRYSRFKDAVESKLEVIDASDASKIKGALELIYHQEFGTSPTQKDQSQKDEGEVVDSGIGDTVSPIKGVEKKPDALTRPLNEYEQKAVKMLSDDKNISLKEAEKLYRERKAKDEAK